MISGGTALKRMVGRMGTKVFRAARVPTSLIVMGSATFMASSVFAQSEQVGTSGPKPGGLNFVPAVTEIHEQNIAFHDFLLWIIIAISLFVLGLLIWVVVRYNEKANPTPSRTTHNLTIEIVWTVVPVLILLAISLYSFPLLYKHEQSPEADIVVKATGHQWYWEYEYPDYNGISFVANMLSDEEAAAKSEPRLLATDNRLVIPVGKTVKLQITASDVLHAWTVPAFGVKKDAVPGRLNELWFNVKEEGVYYGQCSEICGIRHGFMPIAVEVMSEEAFDSWLQKAQVEFAAADEIQVAAR
ncbi:MAG: cytochrome c oxidase subunit II [Pseudomonadota bacterium]